jgi:hypothetical protein
MCLRLFVHNTVHEVCLFFFLFLTFWSKKMHSDCIKPKSCEVYTVDFASNPRHNWVYVSSRYINVFLVEVKFWFQRLLWEELRYSSSLLILLYEAKWWLSVITIIWLNEQVPCEVPSRKHTVQSFHNLSIHLWCLYFRNYACYWMTIGRGWTWKFLFIFQLVCVVSWTLFLYFSAACEVLLVDLCYRFNHSS